MIDLRSDTVTRPGDAMREAAATAEVGDDVHDEDPTVHELEAAAADLLGTEDALYCVSGTMANQVAVRVHTDRGQEIVCEHECHMVRYELAGLAQHSALQVRPIDGGDRGVIDPAAVEAAYVEEDLHRPGTGLVALENTHNYKGGIAIAPDRIDATAEAAHDLGVPVHVDGARLCNAAVAQDVPPARYSEEVDSIMLSLSKGLGAPVGSVLAGSAEFIEQARRTRKLFGGGWRQAGVIAAPALLALENVERLAEDHARATRLAEGLEAIDGLSVPTPETNILVFDVTGTGMDSTAFLEACESEGLLGTPFSEELVRLTTHLDVDDADIDGAIEIVERVAG